MATNRGILAMIVLAGVALLLVLLLPIGKESPAVAHAPSPPTAADAPPPSRIEVPADAREETARENVPIPPAPPVASEDPKPSSVSGLVLDADTGAPIDRFEVVHSPTGAGGHYVDTLFGYELEAPNPSIAFEGTGGRFTLADLGVEARNVTVVAPGYEVPEIQIVELEPNVVNEDLVFRLHRAATVHVRVIDPVSGTPVADALIAWIDDGGQARAGPKERFGRTDALGRFVLDSVPAGPRRLLAGREDLGQAFIGPLELEAGTPLQEIVIELGRQNPR